MSDVDIDELALAVALHEVVDPDIKRRADNVRDVAEIKAPKRTGRLASSVDVFDEEDGYMVGTDVPYAEYQEFGTSQHDPQSFLRPALDAGVD